MERSAERMAYYDAVWEAAFDALLAVDESGVVLAHNVAARELFGGRDVRGEKLEDAVDSDELAGLLESVLEDRGGLEEQFEIGGVYYRARSRAVDVEGGGRIVGVAAQDISDLVDLNRARREMVANISHELRTPITRIRLIIESLFLDADRPKRKASIQSLKEIAMETDSLLRLSQELLDLSMIESGQAIMRLVPTGLAGLVEEAVERLSGQAEMKGLVIVSDIPRGYAVLCDAEQLKRVLDNVIHNAIKWSPKRGTIRISAAEDQEELSVSVMDDGPGVPEELRQRVFERFYQADVSRSGGEGTGLGLAICKHIIEAHGGRVWAEGSARGGHFVFTLMKADIGEEKI